MASDTANAPASPSATSRGKRPYAAPAQRLPALVYLAELRLRTGERHVAAALIAEVGALPLSAADREALAVDLTTAAELATDLRS